MLTFDETLAIATAWVANRANRPVFVDRATGEVHALGSAKIRAWLEEYDRTGTPPNIRDGWR
jgi:hypothetical protein